MNVFDAVKQNISVREVAERYGFTVTRSGMIACPFHNDKTPSMKVDRRFHCFGCQADGDAVDFVSRFYGISPRDAAVKIANDFGISYDNKKRSVSKSRNRLLSQREEEDWCCKILIRYLWLLRKWRTEYVPKYSDVLWHPLFAESISKTDMVEYLLDILIYGTDEERRVLMCEKKNEVTKLEERLQQYAEEFDCGGSAQQPGYDIKRSRTKYDKELFDGIAERSETQ